MSLTDLEHVIDELETLSSAEERQRMFRAFGVIVDVHRDALVRIIDITRESKQDDLLRRFLDDEVIASILRGYRIVDESDLMQRVEAALESVRPLLVRHGGDVRLIDVERNIARLELVGSCDGCAASMITLKKGVEQALYDAVPDLRGVEVEGLTDEETLRQAKSWLPLVSWASLKNGEWLRIEFFEDELLVCTIDDRPFAFLNRCPAGEGTIHDAAFEHLTLTCACHGERFDLRTGASPDKPLLRLRMYPLLVENGTVKIGR